MMVRNEVMNKDWHREYIVAAVHTKGFTLRELSERAGLKKDSLKNALYRSCPKYERIIADAIWSCTAARAMFFVKKQRPHPVRQ